jgi:hypothetical protein
MAVTCPTGALLRPVEGYTSILQVEVEGQLLRACAPTTAALLPTTTPARGNRRWQKDGRCGAHARPVNSGHLQHGEGGVGVLRLAGRAVRGGLVELPLESR